MSVKDNVIDLTTKQESIEYAVVMPRWVTSDVVKHLMSCIDHDGEHTFIVDKMTSSNKVGVSRKGLECLHQIIVKHKLEVIEMSPEVEEQPPAEVRVSRTFQIGDEVKTVDNSSGYVVFVCDKEPGTYHVEGPDETGFNYRVRKYSAEDLIIMRRKVS